MSQSDESARGHDAPIESRDDDLLDGFRVAHAMHRVLSAAPKTWSTRIGLYGAWGSGKTSILNLLREIEEANGAWVVNFSAWSADENIIPKLYETLAEKLRAEGGRPPLRQRAKRAVAAAQTVLGYIWPGMRTAALEYTPVLPSAITKAAASTLERLASAAGLWAKPGRSDLEAVSPLLAKQRIVVFVDDLDRADPRIIPKTLLALREVLDWPGLAFVVAMDRRAIARALADYSSVFGDDAQGFLDKVVDVPFVVPEGDVQTREKFALSVMLECCESVPAAIVARISHVLPPQPRRIKLIARTLGALQPALLRHRDDEIDWLGLCLHLVVREASPDVARWAVNTCTNEDRSDWLFGIGDKKERDNHQAATREHIAGMLNKLLSVEEKDRSIHATMMLLEHWEMTAAEHVSYWAGLLYRDPAITKQEFTAFSEAYAPTGNDDLLDVLVKRGAASAGTSEEESARVCVAMALDSYDRALNEMAESNTAMELDSALQLARQSLRTLEHIWSDEGNSSVPRATNELMPTSRLIKLAGKWVAWTKNEGETELREREKKLATSAASTCLDPWQLFTATDPFFNSEFSTSVEEADLRKAWMDHVRRLLIPRIALEFCDKFLQPDGMVSVSSSEDKLGAWLVERQDSPLYSDAYFRDCFLKTIRHSSSSATSEKGMEIMAKNCLLFLRQILRQTRDGSWGGAEAAEEVCRKHRDMVAAAWAAVVSVKAPFRMRSSIRKTRSDLQHLGMPPEILPEPAWLAAELGS